MIYILGITSYIKGGFQRKIINIDNLNSKITLDQSFNKNAYNFKIISQVEGLFGRTFLYGYELSPFFLPSPDPDHSFYKRDTLGMIMIMIISDFY